MQEASVLSRSRATGWGCIARGGLCHSSDRILIPNPEMETPTEIEGEAVRVAPFIVTTSAELLQQIQLTLQQYIELCGDLRLCR